MKIAANWDDGDGTGDVGEEVSQILYIQTPHRPPLQLLMVLYTLFILNLFDLNKN